MNALHIISRKTMLYIVLVWIAGLVISSYAGGEKSSDLSSSKEMPESCTLGLLAKVYEPVTFAHGMHSLIAEDCGICHHHSESGQTLACNKCHAASLSSKESSILKLKDAYHRQCIGCHKEAEMGPTGCMECHVKRSTKTSSSERVSKTVPAQGAPKDETETYTLSGLEKIYEPVIFSHSMHAEISGECKSCHHHSPPGQTPSCGECHGAPFDPNNLNMPGLKGAYHLQCLGCHRDMDSGPVGCTECHAKKVRQTKDTDIK